MQARFWLMFPLIAVAAFALSMVFRNTGSLQLLERAAADAGARMLQRDVDSGIVVVSIDSGSLARLDQWPWPRHWHAGVIGTIRRGAPSQVFYDIDFSARSSSLDDAALAAELASWTDTPVILPTFWQRTVDGTELVLTQPMAPLLPHARLGSVNLQPSSDGLIRKLQTSWNIGGRDTPSVVMRLSQETVPSETELLIDFTIAPSSFQYVSFADVLDGNIDPAVFQDKTVFIGATAVELGDMLAVPVHRSLPGVVVQALATESIKDGVLQPVAKTWLWILLGIWTAVLAGIFCLTSWRSGIFTFLASAAVAAFGAAYLYLGHRMVLEIMPFIASSGTAFLLATFLMLDEQKFRLIATRLGLRKGDALLQSIFATSADCIISIDANGVIQIANVAAEKLFHCDGKTLCGDRVTTLIPDLCPESDDDGAPCFDALVGSVFERDVRARDGDRIPTEISLSRVQFEEEVLFTMMLRDMSSHREQERILRHQATHDALTQLPNRTALAWHLEENVNDSSEAVALLMLDLDRFKEVNDTLGHSTGDSVLCDVAERFQQQVGRSGFVARIGGDEFAVVLNHERDRIDPEAIASRLLDSMKQPFDASGLRLELGLSIGIAFYPRDADDTESLLKHADVAMYFAKQHGTGFEYYDAAKDGNSVRRLSLIAELRSAIAHDELDLHFQPKIDLNTRNVHGAEALLRWEHPTQGHMNPEEFMSMVEATDLIRPLTEWTLHTGFRQVHVSREAGISGPVAINLSARLLQDRGFPARLQSMMSDANVSAGELEIEITESAMMVDPERAVEIINGVHELGVHISIDDFGTGYSSLAYLRDLPLQELKIDKSFVMSMRQRKDNRVIVDSTLQMAHALGLRVVAEGVETAWEEDYLVRAGCDLAQGYLYSRALPSAEFVRWSLGFNALTQCPEIVVPYR